MRTFFTPESLNGGAGVAAQSVRRELIAAEASASWKSLRLTGEWWLADYRWSQTAPGVAALRDAQIQASYVSLLWLATSGERARRTCEAALAGSTVPPL